MIDIALLGDHPETIPTLAGWFGAQWPAYYAGRTSADIARDFCAEANRSGLPVRLVAFADGELAGTVILRERAIDTAPEYRPGIGGLFVAERYRGRGIGTALVKAGTAVAQEQGYERVFAATATARGILERLGWEPVGQLAHGDERLLLYRCALEKTRSKAHGTGPESGA